MQIREIISIFIVIGIVVVQAGCISHNVPVNTSQNETANSTPSGVNKTYYINGFNFICPIEWFVLGETLGEYPNYIELVRVGTNNPEGSLNIYRNKSYKDINYEKDYLEELKKDPKSGYIYSKNITIDKEPGILIFTKNRISEDYQGNTLETSNEYLVLWQHNKTHYFISWRLRKDYNDSEGANVLESFISTFKVD